MDSILDVMDGSIPDEWERDIHRTYTPADSDREREYVTYLHESGDLRLRIAPSSLDGEETPGYTLQATIYPGLEFSESVRIRSVLTDDRCRAIAKRFMALFSAKYDDPSTMENALEYASERTGESSITRTISIETGFSLESGHESDVNDQV